MKPGKKEYMINSSDFSKCKIEDLKFEALNAKDQEVLNTYAKRSAGAIIGGVIAAAFGAGLLVWAWVFSQNGIGYSIAVSVLSLIVFIVAWSIGGKKSNKAQGVIHGEIESSFYQSARNGSACEAVDYFATVAFPSSEQKVVNMRIPAMLSMKGGLAKEGTEIAVFKMTDSSCAIVFPECAGAQARLIYKLPRG